MYVFVNDAFLGRMYEIKLDYDKEHEYENGAKWGGIKVLV